MQKPHLTSITNPAHPSGQPSPTTKSAHLTEQRCSVLIIDDDPLYVEALSENLRESGYEAITCTDSITAASWLAGGGKCDVVLLDWYMPEMSGRDFLALLGNAGVELPIIVLSGAESDDVEESALGCGAIDFVDKSRRFSVLLKRLEIIMRGTKAEDETVGCEPFSIGRLSLDPRSCRAYWGIEEVGLTITEYRIVHKLAGTPGVDLTYREIYDVVHGEGFHAGDGNDGIRVNVRSLIKRIRQKFREIDESFDEIENYPGHGYRWCLAGRPVAPRRRRADEERIEDTVMPLSA